MHITGGGGLIAPGGGKMYGGGGALTALKAIAFPGSTFAGP